MDKLLCCKCPDMAVWMYMSGSNNYCDNCVPQGCSCNCYPNSDNIEDLNNSDAYVEHKDESGRSYPCCEYEYEYGSEGFKS